MARIVRAGEARSEAERRNEGSTKCVRNPEKREFALQTRDEKCIAFLAFFAKQKASLKKNQNPTFVLIFKFYILCDFFVTLLVWIYQTLSATNT